MSFFIFLSSSSSFPLWARSGAHEYLRADRSSLLPLCLTAYQIYVVPVCPSTSPSHLFLSHFQAFLLYPCDRLQFKEQQTGSLPLRPARCTTKHRCYTCLHLIKKGPPLCAVNPANRQPSGAHRQMSAEETERPFLALFSVSHTHEDSGGNGWFC